MYKLLTEIEDDAGRKFLMLERRKDLLEPILKDINPTHYKQTFEVNLLTYDNVSNKTNSN